MDEYHTPSGLSNLEVLDWQKELQGMDRQIELPFPTMDIKNRRYKVFGMVTNMDWEGERLIHWLHERCGKSEEAHAVMKKDRACGEQAGQDHGELSLMATCVTFFHGGTNKKS